MDGVTLITTQQRTREALIKARGAVGSSIPLQEYLLAAYMDRCGEAADDINKRTAAMERAAELRLLMHELFSPTALSQPEPPKF